MFYSAGGYRRQWPIDNLQVGSENPFVGDDRPRRFAQLKNEWCLTGLSGCQPIVKTSHDNRHDEFDRALRRFFNFVYRDIGCYRPRERIVTRKNCAPDWHHPIFVSVTPTCLFRSRITAVIKRERYTIEPCAGGRTASNIFQEKCKIQSRTTDLIGNWPRNRDIDNGYPCALIGFHDVQLSLHGNRLFSGGFRFFRC